MAVLAYLAAQGSAVPLPLPPTLNLYKWRFNFPHVAYLYIILVTYVQSSVQVCEDLRQWVSPNMSPN